MSTETIEPVEPVEIDGARGEGGGQILRTSLALAVITRRPLRMRRIRANRGRPGLQRQHLACVHAAARLCNAHVRGDELDSQTLELTPGDGFAEHLTIDIGSAGSTTLVVQTVLIPAIVSGRPLRATITGGTHNPLAPPFEFLERVFLPQLRAMGADVTLTLVRHGVLPKGGGELVLEVRSSALKPRTLIDPGPVAGMRATVLLGRLASHIADRELGVVRARFGSAVETEVRTIDGGPANAIMIEVDRGTCRELITEHGEKGLRAELVAERACDAVDAFIAADVPVGEHLADQLLLPLAVAGGGRFRTTPLSLHALTNIDTIRAFLPVEIATDESSSSHVDVTIGAR